MLFAFYHPSFGSQAESNYSDGATKDLNQSDACILYVALYLVTLFYVALYFTLLKGVIKKLRSFNQK